MPRLDQYIPYFFHRDKLNLDIESTKPSAKPSAKPEKMYEPYRLILTNYKKIHILSSIQVKSL